MIIFIYNKLCYSGNKTLELVKMNENPFEMSGAIETEYGYKTIHDKRLSLDEFSELIDLSRKLNVNGLEWTFIRSIAFNKYQGEELTKLILDHFQYWGFPLDDDRILDIQDQLHENLFGKNSFGCIRNIPFKSSRSGTDLNTQSGIERCENHLSAAMLTLEMKRVTDVEGKRIVSYKYSFETRPIVYVGLHYFGDGERPQYRAILTDKSNEGFFPFSIEKVEAVKSNISKFLKSKRDSFKKE